jgi:exodeoxyribonuclease V gamma subunit
VDDLLYSDILDDHAAAVRRLLGELAGVTAVTRLDAGTMLDWLQPQLDNATSLRTSMGGEILLGRLDQIHGLPCRVLAILGLQDGAFPRTSRRPAWDLLSHLPERWDVDPRTQDRQWFLDSILAPCDRLVLSAANRSLRTPHDAPLSSCVEELLRVAGDTMRPAAGNGPLEKQIVYHRIQNFAAEYFSTGSSLPLSFDAAAARIAGDIANADKGIVHPFYSAPGDALNDSRGTTGTLTLAQLIAFWKDPARAWFRAMQLDVSEDDPDDTALDEAPVTLDALQAYAVRATALAARMPSALVGAAVASARMAANRALPPGALGALAWERRDREIQLLATALVPLLAQARPTAIDFPLTPTMRLTGEIVLGPATDGPPWVLVYRPGRYDNRPKYQIEAFILTLAATVHLNVPVACRVLGLDDGQANPLGPIPVEDARRQLETLVAGYAEGQRRPLCFAPATSTKLVEALEQGNDESDALEQADVNWSIEPYGSQPGGEGTAPAATLAWRDTDPFAPPNDHAWLQWAADVAAPLRRWWRQDAT